jgi:hypothetical protein
MPGFSERMGAALKVHLANPGRPIIPAGGDLLWRWFADLSAGRTWGMAGPDPISFEAIDAYRRLTRWPIEERHVRVLLAMDEVFRRHCTADGVGGKPQSRPLTAALFDAVFV